MLLEKIVSLADVQPEIPTWIHTDDLLKNPSVSFSDGCLSDGLMDEKYSECSELFIESLTLDGQQAPVLIEKGRADNRNYFVVNGHHRLAVAARHNLQVLVLIVPVENVWDHWHSSESDYHPDSSQDR